LATMAGPAALLSTGYMLAAGSARIVPALPAAHWVGVAVAASVSAAPTGVVVEVSSAATRCEVKKPLTSSWNSTRYWPPTSSQAHRPPDSDVEMSKLAPASVPVLTCR